MLKLHGYLALDYDDMIGLAEVSHPEYWQTHSIQQTIRNEYDAIDLPKGLGQKVTAIPKCSIRIYYTDTECTLEEAEELVADIFDGGLISSIALEGYSEYTITGYRCEDFTIGGHDLHAELKDHIGQYCWFIIEDK